MVYSIVVFLQRFFSFIKKCRIYIGRSPQFISGPAIIFFPYMPGRMNCGFAGLMTCLFSVADSDVAPDTAMSSSWEKVKSKNLQAITDTLSAPQNYLDHLETLQAMEKVLARLKREDVQSALFFNEDRIQALQQISAQMKEFLMAEEKRLEEQAAVIPSANLEIINSRLILFKDLCWILDRDILANLEKILALAGVDKAQDLQKSAFHKYRKLNLLLNALDRLEVRGRDSAGIQLGFVLNDQKDLEDIEQLIRQKGCQDEFAYRTQGGDLLNQSIFIADGCQGTSDRPCVTFTYKTFSIVGELGRNVAELRKFIQNDRILRFFAEAETQSEMTLTHTRWASVGSITEENCHPVNNFRTCPDACIFPQYPGMPAQINVVLNGDIDNYPALRQQVENNGDIIAPQMTTDTKIIPLQIERHLKQGSNLADAFRLAVNDFEGSHAIAMQSNLEPGKMFLALKGSGQAIYVGIHEDQYMFSSELYGLVEAMPRFIKMNGEAGADAAQGQIFILDQHSSGGAQGIRACYYDGTPITLSETDIQTAEITTRDIDRSSYPHFFLKEISESSLSLKRTLRGKYRIVKTKGKQPQVAFNLGADIVPEAVRKGLQNNIIKNIVVIGHGTAAVAGQAIADALSYYLQGANLAISARIASELSGFGLKDDLSDTLVIPITQSGTTTDTNRAVTMARERGAQIISIVNRRQSDITSKSHGVFYTSDGRDIEMSVASTKAFYAQIVAGQVLALYFAKLLNTQNDPKIARELEQLESAPLLMNRIFARRQAVADSVKKNAGKRFWAIVGSGPNKASADEIRIKLSELCYKTISTDIVENKKHIDLSAEPLILVCASGNPEAVMEDVVKDVAIFKAHKAAVVVFADEGDERFDHIADAVIPIPVAPPPLPVILNTMAGHLWGYYAARAIDEEAQIFRLFRSRLATALLDGEQKNLSVFDMIADSAIRRILNDFYLQFNDLRQNGALGVLAVKTMSDLLLLLKYASGKLPLQDIRHDFKSEGEDLVSPFELLDATLSTAIDELTRPIDAIRHQAKTVTVGTSRKEKELQGIIYDLLKELHFNVKHLTYRNILTLNRIQPAIAGVRGHALYNISGLDDLGNPGESTMIAIRSKGGIAAQMTSRADSPMTLMGTKRMIVSSGHVYTGRGKADGAPLVVIPLLGESNIVENLLLLHISYNENLAIKTKTDVLGYRYQDIRNIITEYNHPWQDDYLEAFSLETLFSESVESIAGEIKSRFGILPVAS